MDLGVESDGDVEALAAVLSFVDEALNGHHAGLRTATDNLSPSSAWLQPTAACSESPADVVSELDDALVPLDSLLELDGDFDASASLMLEWDIAQHVGDFTDSVDGGDCGHDAVKMDGQSSSSVTSVAVNDGDVQPHRAKPARKQRASSKIQRRNNVYNPNRARDEQRRELRRLRTDASELEEQLSVLRSHRCHLQRSHGASDRGGSPTGTTRSGVAESIATSVWKAIAERQLEKRMAVVHESNQLRSAVQENQATIMRMAKLLRSHNAEKVSAQLTDLVRCRCG
jgi:hypothetical protein